MAGLAQLKKRLRSVELSGQLAGAMKTVSSAKYAKINKLFTSYHHYAAELEKLSAMCGESLTGKFAGESEDAVDCYVILGYNRGLCGGYNAELHSYAEQILRENPGSCVIVCGKCAISYLEEKGFSISERFLLPDIPDFDSCRPLMEATRSLFDSKKIKSVSILYQRFINTLAQTPAKKELLPFSPNPTKSEPNTDILWVPDRETVMGDLQRRIYETVFYQTVLEAAIGAQSATLMAMRTAYDNAADTAEKLENEINKKRQSAVTMGVLETSAGMAQEWEAENGDG